MLVLDRADSESYVGDTAELPSARAHPVAAVLIGVSGELTGVLHPVAHGENQIGRDKASDIRLPGRYIPRTHARLVLGADGFTLQRLSPARPMQTPPRAGRATTRRKALEPT
jgi:hypothetical protein